MLPKCIFNLNPCPRCHSQNVCDNYDYGYFWVECRDCKCKTKDSFEDLDKALDNWNKGLIE